MAIIYTRSINGVKIRFGKYSDNDYVIYVGKRLYAEIDNLADANREYNNVDERVVKYLGM